MLQRRRQENLAAKKEQEARMQELMQAKLRRASEQAAAVHQQRQVQLRLQQNSKAATKHATIQTIKERAELAAEEKRRHYLVKSWIVDDKIRKFQEERTAAEVWRLHACQQARHIRAAGLPACGRIRTHYSSCSSRCAP